MAARLRITLCSLVLITGLSGCEENGPTIKDPSSLFGCYQLEKQKIQISARDIIIKGLKQKTKIKRFLALKDRNSVNVVNDIKIDHYSEILSIGSAKSGFSYNFDDGNYSVSILIPDNSGNIMRLKKTGC